MWEGFLITAALAGGPLSLEHTGTVTLDGSVVDQHGDTFSVTGVSGVVWSGGNAYYAVMDNSHYVFTLHVEFGSDGSVELSTTSGLSLDRSGDYEDISVNPSGDILLSDEGSQQVIRFDPITGAELETTHLPAIYSQHRSNLGCESFDLAQDQHFCIANEEALVPDGPRATPEHGTWVRLLHGVPSDGAAQYAYQVDAMPGPYFPFTNDGQSGLVAVVPLPDESVLAMERSLAFVGAFFETRIYLVTVGDATDVSDISSLDGAQFTPVTKTLLYTGAHQNLEGLCLGPALGDGRHALLGVVDDGDPISTNKAVAFVLSGLDVCAADLNDDEIVGTDDLLTMIAQWGPCNDDCEADLDEDGEVGADDLLNLLSQWGGCP